LEVFGEWGIALGDEVINVLLGLGVLVLLEYGGEVGKGTCIKGKYISEKEERAKPASNIYYYYNINNLFK
jgi:hypothetical protein